MAQPYVCPGGDTCIKKSCPDVCNRKFPANTPGVCITENGFRGCYHPKTYHDVEIQPNTTGMDMYHIILVYYNRFRCLI